MGMLVEGEWKTDWYDTKKNQGAFKREASSLRNWVTADGSKGQSGKEGYKAESNRYHLYVSLACPWAHRTFIFRTLKELENHISLSIVSPKMLDKGWTFNLEDGSTGDPINQFDYLYQVYQKNNPTYSGRVTVPILWDKQTNSIVSNESSEIILMLNSAFNSITHNTSDYYPSYLQEKIDTINAFVYENINNGVYRCGFATTQKAYEEAFVKLFDALEKIEAILDQNRYLVGNNLSVADWRLFTTLIRFDVVYHGHFKCNKKRIEDYPNLSEYVRELYQWSNISSTVNFEQIKQHYYFSHTMINPTQIVPLGPEIDYSRPYKRRKINS